MRLFAVLLLSISFLIPISLKAESILVFMDNSASIKHLHDIYLREIETIMGLTGSNQVHFAVIGTSYTRNCKLLGSGIPTSERRVAIQNTFNFQDQNTLIYNSLKSVESCEAFKETDNILIISDMEPDHQVSAGSFVFDRQDLDDANNTHNLLKGWVAQGKQLHIVLHDWENVPERDNRDFEPFISTDESLISLWRAQKKKARQGKLVREYSTNRKLVALSLLELKEYEPSAVHLFSMPLKKNNKPNHEGFRQVLCGFLPISPSEAAGVCDVEILKEFSVAIEISRPLALSRYFDQLRGLIKEIQLIGPLRHFKIVSLKKGRWRKCDARLDHNIKADFYFRMCEGDSSPSYREPRLRTFAKDANGQWLPDDTFKVKKTDAALPNKERATRWLASSINAKHREIVSKYYKVPAPLKTIYLVSQDQNPVLGNYQLFVQYRFEGGQNDEETKRRLANKGIVKLPIPREGIGYAKLCLNTEEGCYYLGDLDVDDIDSPSDITFTIQARQKVPVTLKWGQFQKTGVEIFHKGGALGDEKVSVYKETFHSAMPAKISLLPGRYYWEAIPVNDKEKVLGSLGDLTVLSPKQGDEKKIWLELKNDPLAERSQWDSVMGGLLDSSGELTEEGQTFINGSAYFFVALLHYTSSKLDSSPDELRKLWQKVEWHIEDLSTDKPRLLRRSLSMIKLGDKNENLLNIMFDMFIRRESSALRGSTRQVQKARSSYKRWIKDLSRVITPALAKILSKGKG